MIWISERKKIKNVPKKNSKSGSFHENMNETNYSGFIHLRYEVTFIAKHMMSVFHHTKTVDKSFLDFRLLSQIRFFLMGSENFHILILCKSNVICRNFNLKIYSFAKDSCLIY